jgi:hypothetical protein
LRTRDGVTEKGAAGEGSSGQDGAGCYFSPDPSRSWDLSKKEKKTSLTSPYASQEAAGYLFVLHGFLSQMRETGKCTCIKESVFSH